MRFDCMCSVIISAGPFESDQATILTKESDVLPFI